MGQYMCICMPLVLRQDTHAWTAVWSTRLVCLTCIRTKRSIINEHLLYSKCRLVCTCMQIHANTCMVCFFTAVWGERFLWQFQSIQACTNLTGLQHTWGHTLWLLTCLGSLLLHLCSLGHVNTIGCFHIYCSTAVLWCVCIWVLCSILVA